MSIVSFGLGGSATNMIINHFGLGGLDVEIIIPDLPRQVGRMGVWIPRKKKEREIIFVIRYKGKVWYRRYMWRDNFINAYIIVTGGINKVISNIKFAVRKIQTAFKGFRIKR